MSKEYPLFDKVLQRFYRWEVLGNQKIKAYEPDVVACGVPAKMEQPKQEESFRYCQHCALHNLFFHNYFDIWFSVLNGGK